MNVTMKYMQIFGILSLILFGCYVYTATITYTNLYTHLDLNSVTFTISKPGSYAFYNDTPYPYTPVNLTSSNPMMKIIASDVIVDFNDIGLSNTDTTHSGWVGIEIGWSPAELAADSTRVQPKNITIKNMSLYSFDCGIIIHSGIHSVTIENCNFYETVVGVAMLGKLNLECASIRLKNVKAFGYYSDNSHDALVNTKTLIETTYGYGADYFMPLAADSLNANSVDVYTYYGIWLNYVINSTLSGVRVENIGYENFVAASEGNGLRTNGIGLRITNASRITMQTVDVIEISSELKAVGLQLDNIQEIDMSDCNFSYCSSNGTAVGIQVTNALSLPFSVEAMKLKNVVTRSNMSLQGVAYGMDLSSVSGLFANNITCKFNKGLTQAYGCYSTKLYTIDIRDSSFSENNATSTTNNVATTQGIVAAGFYAANANSMQHYRSTYGSTTALNSAYGIYLNNSSSCQFFECEMVANTTTSGRSGEAAAIRTAQDGQEISKYGPCVDAASTGAYGVYIINSKYIRFEDGVANSNTGHRAVGFYFRSCRAVALRNCFASTQMSTGFMLDSSFLTDNVANPSAIPIIAFHKPLLFGDLTKTTVDAVTATDLYLDSLAKTRASRIAGSEAVYADMQALMATNSLLLATIARYRLWSVAYGVQAHNVAGFLIDDCTCAGQVSAFDNGAGICFSGRNTGHTVNNCRCLFNTGGGASIQTAATNPAYPFAYTYNLAGQKVFWDTLLQQKQPWTLANTTSIGSQINAIAVSPDGTMFAVGLSSGTVQVYNATSYALLQTLSGHSSAVTSLAWRPDGTQLASADLGTSNNINIWNTTTWLADFTITQASGGVYAMAFKPSGLRLATAGVGATDNIVIWETATYTVDTSISHGTGTAQAVVWSADGSRLVSGSNDTTNNMVVWNTTTWLPTNTLTDHTDAVTSLSYNTANTLLASGSVDTTVKVWDTTAWTVSHTLSASQGAVHAVKFKSDDKLIAAGYDNNLVKVWKTTSWGSVEATLTDFTGAVLALDWSKTGRRLMAGGVDGSYRCYNANIFKQAASTSVVGLYNASNNYIAQDSLVFNSTIDGNSVFVDLKGTQRPLISPVGPIGAGIIMADMMLEGIIQDSNIYANLGNAGHGYGVLLDKAFSVTLQNNNITGNNSNVHGFTAGIMDVTNHSPNLYMNNFLEGNKSSTFNNANYFVPFNPSDANTLAFPVKKIMNGKFEDTATEFDNLVVEYSQDSAFYQYDYLATNPIATDFRTYLTSNNLWS